MPAARLALTAQPLDMGALSAAVLSDIGGAAGGGGLVRRARARRESRAAACHTSSTKPTTRSPFVPSNGSRPKSTAVWPGVRVGVHHRTGRLEIGEASIAIVAASAHRAEAFAACRYAIERVKQIAPIWKHEHFDGGEVWIEGATADPGRRTARGRGA